MIGVYSVIIIHVRNTTLAPVAVLMALRIDRLFLHIESVRS